MAKKQKSFADKASGRGGDADATMVKYVKSVKSEKTGFWRFNEQMIKVREGEDLNAALKRMDEASNLVDIDLSGFVSKENDKKENVADSNNESDDSMIDLMANNTINLFGNKYSKDNRALITLEMLWICLLLVMLKILVIYLLIALRRNSAVKKFICVKN